MAKQPQKAGPQKSSAEGKPVPYPKNWGSMKPEERQAWMKTNRPNRPVGVPAKAVQPPVPHEQRPQPVAVQEPEQQPREGKQLVQIDVIRYSVRVGTREPVECGPEELLYKVDEELDAWEEQCQSEYTNEEGEQEES